ncbi:site-specific DNA-methyltransferase [Desulfovibrio sp. ZJ200]|uniref:site-specific DNA-methyltransferase n=1 Tax=Desulfovibrio sp. ZJ200 TaxID=2709792 RepID=UPI0013ED01E8|nr:site-specific DNA-methyltransferase [Desulfovibrio sp. ZJ200]
MSACHGHILCGDARDVLPTRPYAEAHFATFPPDLIRPCVLAGCPAGGFVLDPFCGSGTVGQVCIEEGHRFIGIEINPDYVAMAENRIGAARPRGPRQVSLWDAMEAMA